ncbi:hypothetical protein Efla_006820 [Eimeria flavescens]
MRGGPHRGPFGAPRLLQRGSAACSLCCIWLLLLSTTAAAAAAAAAAGIASKERGAEPFIVEPSSQDGAVTITVSLPEFLPFSALDFHRDPSMGARLLKKGPHPLYRASLWGPYFRTILLRVNAQTPTRQLLLLLLGSSTAAAELLLQQQEQHEELLQQLQRQQQHQRYRGAADILISSLAAEEAFKEVQLYVHLKSNQQSPCSRRQQFGGGSKAGKTTSSSSSSSSSRCRRQRKALVEEAASLLEASSLQQQHAVSLLARFGLRPLVADSSRAANERRGSLKETPEATSSETVKACLLDLLADGCVAGDIKDVPLQLVIRQQEPIADGDLLGEIVAEWQDRRSFELLLSLRLQRSLLDLTGAFINVRVYLFSASSSTEVLAVPASMSLFVFVASLFALSPAADAATAAAATAAAAAAAAAGLHSNGMKETAELHAGVEAFSLEGEELNGALPMRDAAAKGIVLKASRFSPLHEGLLSLQQTRIFCFSCGNNQGGPPGAPVVVASSLLLHTCSEAPYAEETEIASETEARSLDVQTLEKAGVQQRRNVTCRTGSFSVSLVPLATTRKALAEFILAAAGASPAAAGRLLFCVGLSSSVCISLTALHARMHASEMHASTCTGARAQACMHACMRACVAVSVGELLQGSLPLHLSPLLPAVNKSLVFVPLVGSGEESRRNEGLPPFFLRIQLPSLGAVAQQQQTSSSSSSSSSRGGALLVVIGGVAADTPQEKFLRLLVRQRMPGLPPHHRSSLRLCFVPRTPAAAAAGAEGETAAVIPLEAQCVRLREGSTMGEVLDAARRSGASVLHVLQHKGDAGDTRLGRGRSPAADAAPMSEVKYAIVYPIEVALSDALCSVFVELPDGGLFAVSDVPVSASASDLLEAVRLAVASSPETLVRFPTGLNAQSLVFVFPKGDRLIPEATPVSSFCCLCLREEEKETAGDRQREEETEEGRCNNEAHSPAALMLQFKFRPLEAPAFQLRMQPMRNRVLDFRSLLFTAVDS